MADITWLNAEEAEAELKEQERLQRIKEQTIMETQRGDLLSVLTARFGSIPREARERIDRCNDPASLRQLFIRGATISRSDLL